MPIGRFSFLNRIVVDVESVQKFVQDRKSVV